MRWSFDARKTAYKANDIHWFFQSFKLKTVGGLTERQVEAVQEKMAANTSKQPGLISASLGQKKYNKTVAEKRAKEEIELFTFKTVFTEMGDQLYKEMFDLDNLSAAEAERLKNNVEELVLSRL